MLQITGQRIAAEITAQQMIISLKADGIMRQSFGGFK
jgi:hypothetical protein